jgi:hypothetical protein
MYLFDACIIGAGPAGLTLAMELADQGLNVVVVESGTETDNPTAQLLSDAEILTAASHEIMADAVKRGLGGTSALWGGRCVPLDAIDFEKRDCIDGSGWPLQAVELEPYYARACAILSVGEPAFSVATCNTLSTHDKPLSANFKNTNIVLSTQLERWGRSLNVWLTFKKIIQSHPNITIKSGHTCIGFRQERLNAPVTEILLKNTSSHDPEPIIIKSRFFVIACGGVESTRLVLNSINDPLGLKLVSPQLVGHYYMGHPSGKIADIQLSGDPKKTLYGFESDGGVYIRRRITLQSNTLRKENLLNIAFWFDNPPIADWQHGSGLLSAAYLALTAPLLGRWLAPAAIRKRLAGGYDMQRLRHLLNCLHSPLRTLGFCVKFFWSRYIAKPRIPGFFTYSANNRYALHYHAEQAPNWESIITLSNEVDALGLKRAKIALKWSQQDIDSIIKAHQVLDQNLQDNGIGRLVYRVPPEQLNQSIQEQAVDGFHQIGTLRMSADAALGVTDGNGRLWGTQNVFIASSAIFPTSGQANPTLTMVALAVRQAEYIAGIFHNKTCDA